ncbi:hypothetical protein OTK55_06505 [Methanosphaera sp. Vir-13MRS]|uniref:hypothetical protein n=1 Tax=Candidatus Methanosphaera massiliense TaxID=3017187 RepID=UPI0023807CD6|nr:hypothetical protein [Candidatus Methanosphaera massiliense]MDE4078666.1 hypothetical protein [Candidatus Methanosphaera massiliense]
MILNDFLGDSSRIEILESFLDNEGYSLTLDDVRRISEVSNPLPDLTILVKIGVLSERNGEYELNLKDKRVIYLSLIDNEEYSRKIKEMNKKGIFNEVKTFSSDINYIEQNSGNKATFTYLKEESPIKSCELVSI